MTTDFCMLAYSGITGITASLIQTKKFCHGIFSAYSTQRVPKTSHFSVNSENALDQFVTVFRVIFQVCTGKARGYSKSDCWYSIVIMSDVITDTQ